MVTVTWTMGTMTVSITGDSVNEAKLTRDVFFPSTAAAPKSRRLVDLVGELEGLIERLWGRDYMKAATFREARLMNVVFLSHSSGNTYVRATSFRRMKSPFAMRSVE